MLKRNMGVTMPSNPKPARPTPPKPKPPPIPPKAVLMTAAVHTNDYFEKERRGQSSDPILPFLHESGLAVIIAASI